MARASASPAETRCPTGLWPLSSESLPKDWREGKALEEKGAMREAKHFSHHFDAGSLRALHQKYLRRRKEHHNRCPAKGIGKRPVQSAHLPSTNHYPTQSGK